MSIYLWIKVYVNIYFNRIFKWSANSLIFQQRFLFSPYWFHNYVIFITIMPLSILPVFSIKIVVIVVSCDLWYIFHNRKTVKIQLIWELDLAPLSVHKVTRILFCKPDITQLLKALKEKGHKNDLRISVNCPGHVHQSMECYSLREFLDILLCWK